MSVTNYEYIISTDIRPLQRFVIGLCLLLVLPLSAVVAQTTISEAEPETVTVENAPDQEVITIGKNVIVRGGAKGVLVFGGDIIVEGNVTGDVATIGGSVIQREKGRIGGDVFVIGGSYSHELQKPLRTEGRETVVYAGYETELRQYAKNPSLLFTPSFSWSFLVQRLFSLLFWFVAGYLLTLVSPGAVSRAVGRYRTATLSVFAVGGAGFVLATLVAITSVGVFPGFISGLIAIMAFVSIILAYVFGRVVLQVSVGKRILKFFKPDSKPSDTFAILIGASFWTVMLSLPFVWIAALFVLFAASIGLVLTARRNVTLEGA